MNFHYIGWCKEERHDKVWVLIFLAQHKFLTIWGRRGKTLQHKLYHDLRWGDIDKLIFSKSKKGYKSIDKLQLDQVYPTFQEDLERTAIWAILSAD